MRILIGLFTGALAGATPILLAALGGAFTYHAGLFNIAMEGMLLAGAFGAAVGAYLFESWLAGLAGGVLAASLLAGLFILFAIGLKTDEFVTGIALNLLAVGATTYLLRQLFGVKGSLTDPRLQAIPALTVPGLDQIPVLGELLSGHNLVVYLAGLLTAASAWLLYRTRFGLRLRAAGHHAAALDASGVSTAGVRARALLICGVLCGLGGAFLSLGYVRLFAENMSAGRGWIALAAIILAGGHPLGVLVAALVFGLADGLGLFLQSFAVPAEFAGMTPYVATLLALYVYAARKRRSPVEAP